MPDESASEEEQVPIETGATVYNEDGDELGTIVTMSSEGFEVSTESDTGSGEDADGRAGGTGPDAVETSEQEHNPGQEFGEGYIMWRCQNCGEMGELDDGLPQECPNCGSEEVAKWKED